MHDLLKVYDPALVEVLHLGVRMELICWFIHVNVADLDIVSLSAFECWQTSNHHWKPEINGLHQQDMLGIRGSSNILPNPVDLGSVPL